MFNSRNFQKGFLLFESSYMRLVEDRCVAAHRYLKEIEIIIQVIKSYFDEHQNYMFNINATPGCNIDIADDVNFYIHYDMSDSNDAVYDAETVVYDKDSNHLKSLDIHLLLSDRYNESKIRQNLTHELNHAYEDFCLQTVTKDTSLVDSYDLSQVDINLVMQFYDANDEIAFLLYRLFIKTETNAFVSQIYADLESLNKTRKLERKNFADDVKLTETYQQYDKLRSVYKNSILNHKINLGKVMKFFPDVMSRRFDIAAVNRKEFDKRFEKWFRYMLKHQLKIVWIKLCKAASMFYDDTEDELRKYTYDDILQGSKKVAIKLFENADDLINDVERYSVRCVYEDRRIKYTSVLFNPVILKFRKF